MSIFSHLAHGIARRPLIVVIAWVALAATFFSLAAVGVGGYGNLEHRTGTGVPEVPGSDAFRVTETFLGAVPADAPSTVTGQFLGYDPQNPDIAGVFLEELHNVAEQEDVISVSHPFGAPLLGPAFDPVTASGDPIPPAALVTNGEPGFLVFVSLASSASEDVLVQHKHIRDALTEVMALASVELRDSVEAESPSMHVFSNPLFFDSFDVQLQEDLITGEAIALPLALLVMVLVFGGFLAASTPIIGAIASIAGGLAVLYGFTFIQDIDSAAPNVVTVLGIGLCIDYGLLIVSRFREELKRAQKNLESEIRTHALVRTMETAGRTVFFSGITVAIAVSGLLFFAPEFLTGIGGAALGVVTTAVLVAMTLVPAIAYLYGERIVRPGPLSKIPGIRTLVRVSADVERDEGFFSSLATWVQRRPWLVLTMTFAILLAFAWPATSLTLRNSESETLPLDDPDRSYLAAFDDRYPLLAAASVEGAAIQIMAESTVEELTEWSATVQELPGVVSVSPVLTLPEEPELAFVGVQIEASDKGSPAAISVVEDIRALDSPFPTYVGGQAANQIDFVNSVVDGLPVAAGVVVVATFVLLFLMTGSILVPLKTLIINSLSLTASVGILVTIFQYGWFDDVLGIDSLGGIETYVLVLLVAFGFGLAMDYEVFLLARIKELVDSGMENNAAVRLGLQRSGRIITSAAAIIILVFLGFAAGDVLIIKQVGIGLAIAVFLDATIVRMLLVPASMTLLGRWNWWAPRSLRNIYEKMSITH